MRIDTSWTDVVTGVGIAATVGLAAAVGVAATGALSTRRHRRPKLVLVHDATADPWVRSEALV